MSMQNYACTGYGIILNGTMDSEKLEEMSDNEEIEAQFSFTGEAFPIDDHGIELWGEGDTYDDESLYFIGLPRYPVFFKRAYKDMAEMVKDMAKAYRSVKGLPKLSLKDIRKRIRSFQGTYYG